MNLFFKIMGVGIIAVGACFPTEVDTLLRDGRDGETSYRDTGWMSESSLMELRIRCILQDLEHSNEGYKFSVDEKKCLFGLQRELSTFLSLLEKSMINHAFSSESYRKQITILLKDLSF